MGLINPKKRGNKVSPRALRIQIMRVEKIKILSGLGVGGREGV
jgi:hypothetical protein